jgi:hypothetical protein
MTTNPKGAPHLAWLARQLPARARIGLAVVAAHLALDRLRDHPNYTIALNAFDLARRWFDGERFDPDRFEDAIHDEHHEGLDTCAYHARSTDERSAWSILGNAVAYTAHHAYQGTGTDPSPAVSEVDESIVDEIDALLRALSPDATKRMTEAAKYLETEPAASFAQLSAML